MSAGNRPMPGISAIPGINKIPGFDGKPMGMHSMPFGGVVGALSGGPQVSKPADDMPPVLPVPAAPGAIPAGMQMVNGALGRKPQQQLQSPFGSTLGGYGRRLWG